MHIHKSSDLDRYTHYFKPLIFSVFWKNMEICISDFIPLMYIAMCHFKFMKNKQYCINGNSARAFKVRLNFLNVKGNGSTAGTVLAARTVSVKKCCRFENIVSRQ